MIDYTYEDAKDLDGAMHNLFHITQMLRTPEGCPWDREQRCEDVVQALQDESFEYIDALAKKDIPEQREEIGDIMINMCMLLNIHQEQNDFAAVDAINEVCRKLVRRHPHVFSDATAKTSEQVLTQWNDIKVNVEGKKNSDEDFFSRVPKSLPPLEAAYEIQKKARKVGFDWKETQDVIDKVCEELDETIEAKSAIDFSQEHLEEELGDLLFSVVNLARFLKVRPSTALHKANQKFKRRFNAMQAVCKERSIELTEENFSQMDQIWDEIKHTV